MLHRPRDLLVRQRTMLVNAIRGHLAEFSIRLADQSLVLAKGGWRRDPNSCTSFIGTLSQLAA